MEKYITKISLIKLIWGGLICKISVTNNILGFAQLKIRLNRLIRLIIGSKVLMFERPKI